MNYGEHAAAAMQVMTVIERAVRHWTSERRLALAVVNRTVIDACSKQVRFNRKARIDIADGDLDWWLEGLGVDPEYAYALIGRLGLSTPLPQSLRKQAVA